MWVYSFLLHSNDQNLVLWPQLDTKGLEIMGTGGTATASHNSTRSEGQTFLVEC